MTSTIYDWLKKGFTPVPHTIFNQFQSLDLSSDELVLILYLFSQITQAKPAEDISSTARQLGWSSHKVTEILNQLMNKNYLEIELVPNSKGKQSDHYTLRPFFETLDRLDYPSKTTNEEIPAEDKTGELLQRFEEEFGRPLSQIELETVNNWLHQNNYSEDLVLFALRQAVLNGAISLRYIDKILLNWSKKNIQTIEEAQRESERFDQKHSPSTNIANTKATEFEIPIDYWNQKNN